MRGSLTVGRFRVAAHQIDDASIEGALQARTSVLRGKMVP
jgi:hypothetical protein